MTAANKHPRVDAYLADLKNWQAEITLLRAIMLESGLEEDWKWGKPCYTASGKNIVIIQGFKNYAALLFFKGVLLTDPAGILVKTGENTEVGRQLRFTDPEAIAKLETTIKTYIAEAVDIEKAGLKVPIQPQKVIAMPAEFQAELTADKALNKAFEKLTPGRQRAYLRYFSEAKQTTTRVARIEKYRDKILAGKGMTDK